MDEPGGAVAVQEPPVDRVLRPRGSWPNSRAAREGGERSLNRTGRRAAVPGPRGLPGSTTGALLDLEALLALPVQRSAPPAWADGLPAAHPSAPVPPVEALAAWLAGPADADAVDEAVARTALPVPRREPDPAPLPTRRGRRAAAGPVDAPPAPSAEPSQPAPGSRRARRAAAGPADAAPRPTAPAAPGSRRALREQGRAPQVDAPPADRRWEPLSSTDSSVLARLEALLAEPVPVGPASEALDDAGLDLRTDPLLPATGWTRHELPAEVPAEQLTEQPAEQPAGAPVGPQTAPTTGRTSAPASPETALALAEALQSGAEVFTPRRGKAHHRLSRRTRSAFPQAAVIGVLGVVTLVAPLVGTHLRAEAGAPTTAGSTSGESTVQAVAAAGAAQAAELLAERAGEALARSSARDAAALAATTERADAAKAEQERLAAEAAAKAEAERVAAEQAAQAAEAHRQAVAALVGDCSGERPDLGDARNGRLDDSAMCALTWSKGHRLRSDAAVAFAELNLAYRERFGQDMVITDSYRSYAAQVKTKRSKPRLAAVPGTSEHGWALAVDLGGGVNTADEHYDWLIENAPEFGWDHPAWARKGGGGPYEPWHWEYVAGE